MEGRIPCKGPAANVIHQLVGGPRAAMGYTGNANNAEMQDTFVFQRITDAGHRGSHVHDVTVIREVLIDPGEACVPGWAGCACAP